MSESESIWNDAIISSRMGRKSESFYEDEKRACQYNASTLIWEDAKNRVNQLHPDPSWSVLEIGPGPGVMTIPLAKKIHSLTVVEPASPMILLLREHLSENGLDNVSIIQKTWESVNPEELGIYDLVLGSYSLDMADIHECLLKMITCAKREVHLWWFMGTTFWESVREDLIPGNALKSPKADVLMRIIEEMGYAPTLQKLSNTSFPARYENVDDAHTKMRGILNISQSVPLPKEAIAYIEEHWRRPDGGYGYDDTTTYVHITIPVGTGE